MLEYFVFYTKIDQDCAFAICITWGVHKNEYTSSGDTVVIVGLSEY